jgi:signal transduction histidine kinase
VLWNTIMLALLLGVLGGILRYAVKRTIMASVDRQLDLQTRPHFDGPPPDGGPHGFWRGVPFVVSSDPGPRGPEGGPGFGPGPGGGEPGFGPGGNGSGPGFGPGDHESRGWQTEGAGMGPGDSHGPGHRREPGNGRWLAGVTFRSKWKSTDTLHFRIFGLDGRSRPPFDTSPLLDNAAFLSSKSGATLYAIVSVEGAQARIISRPIIVEGRIVGVAQAGYPLADINRALVGLDRVLLIFIPIALLCAAVAGRSLTGRVLSRVRGMTHAAARIGSQNFSQRIPVVGHDEFSELAETFNGLLGRLQGAIDQQRRFTADASHELKSPLTIIQGNTGIALSDPSDAEGCREALLEIDRAAETMSVLVRDLLLLARSDAGRLGQKPIDLLVSEVVERALVSARHERTACVSVSIPDETLSVRGNEEELIRLFANLLNNARQHTPPGGRITVTARRDSGSVLVIVEDTGTGIAPEHLPHLGERFYRVDSARARVDGGTGLGLSICKSIAAAHGGDLTIASDLGKGTTVTVRLPAAD